MISSSFAIKGTVGAAIMLASATFSQAFSADGINYVNYWYVFGENVIGQFAIPTEVITKFQGPKLLWCRWWGSIWLAKGKYS
jgi:hypothetical protein